ncbi:HTH myb-type domain-containing protein [Psidium guajava]|nr:HTH myb-type domain-containing protein [Psidium guajava]
MAASFSVPSLVSPSLNPIPDLVFLSLSPLLFLHALRVP